MGKYKANLSDDEIDFVMKHMKTYKNKNNMEIYVPDLYSYRMGWDGKKIN